MTITRTLVYQVNLTPQEVAAEFASWTDEDQAAFLNALWPITSNWPGAGWCQQCSNIAPHLDHGGSYIVAKLAEWAADPEGLLA